MNINYASIIEAADKRKSALQAIEQLVNQAGIHAEAVAAAVVYVAKMQSAFSSLDDEGRKLLPAELRHALGNVHLTRTNLDSAHLAVNSYGGHGLKAIAKFSEAA